VVALTGTNLLRPILEEIKDRKYGRVYLALDNDAIDKAFSIMRRLHNTIPNLRMLPLEQDVKNMSTENLEKILTDYGVMTYAN